MVIYNATAFDHDGLQVVEQPLLVLFLDLVRLQLLIESREESILSNDFTYLDVLET